MFKENPTTGYTWQLQSLQDLGLSSSLRLVSSEYVQDQNRRGAVGVGGIRTFLFEALAQTEADVNFYHGRAWEMKKDTDDGKTLESYVQKVIHLAVGAV